MSATKKKEKAKTEVPSKAPARVARMEREESEHEEGEAVDLKPKKKKSSIVAIKHRAVYDRLTVSSSKGKLGKTRKVSMYEAMIAEGYSEEYARAGQLPKSKTWNKLLDERLGDDKLTNVHKQLMVAKKLDYMLFTAEIKDEDIYELLESVLCTPKKIVHGIQGTHVWFWSPDNKTRKDALELAHKIRGKMSPEVIEVKGGLQAMSDEELAIIIKKQTSKLRKND